VKRASTVVAVAVLALGLAPLAMAQTKVEGVRGSSTESVTATVEAVDLAKRMLTVKGPDGKVVSFRVSDAVKRLPEVKVGDKITATYTETVSFKVLAAGAPAAAAGGAAVAAGTGAKPSGTAMAATTVTVVITAIDKAAESVTIKSPDGKSHTIKVQEPKNLELVKVGDSIQVTYTEALAVDVTAPVQ
jgi:hypothetical protein